MDKIELIKTDGVKIFSEEIVKVLLNLVTNNHHDFLYYECELNENQLNLLEQLGVGYNNFNDNGIRVCKFFVI